MPFKKGNTYSKGKGRPVGSLRLPSSYAEALRRAVSPAKLLSIARHASEEADDMAIGWQPRNAARLFIGRLYQPALEKVMIVADGPGRPPKLDLSRLSDQELAQVTQAMNLIAKLMRRPPAEIDLPPPYFSDPDDGPETITDYHPHRPR